MTDGKRCPEAARKREMDRKAVLEIGTNSVKLLVGERTGASSWKVVFDGNEVLRLGEGLGGSGSLSPEAMDRTVRGAGDFLRKARTLGAPSVFAAGTMALRRASNAEAFARRFLEETGEPLHVLSGETEALYSYRGVLSGGGGFAGECTVFDIGGGSTEVIWGRDGEIFRKLSADLGVVSLSEMFFPGAPSPEEDVKEAVSFVRKVLKGAGVGGIPPLLAGTGGTVTSMAAVKLGLRPYDGNAVQGQLLSLEEVQNQIRLYASCSMEMRRNIPGLSPKREEVILAGACIVLGMMQSFSAASCLVSDRGLRHGLLESLLQ